MSRLARSVRFAVFCLLVLLSATDRLLAQTAVDATESSREARRYFLEGYKAVERDDFEAARIAFEKSYALSPEPDTLRNLGASQIQSGHLLHGARNLARFIAEAKNLDQDEADELRKLLVEAEMQLGRIECATNLPGASIFIDGEAVGVTPLQGPYHVNPGDHSIRAEKEGYMAPETHASVRAGELVAVEFALRAAEAPAAPRPSPGSLPVLRPQVPEGNERPPGQSFVNRTTVTIGLAVLTVGTAAVAYGFHQSGAQAEDDARDASGELEAMYGSAGCATGAAPAAACASLDDKIDAADRAYKYSNIASVGAVAFGLGAIAAFVLWPSPKASEQKVAVTSWITPHSSGLSVSSAF